MTSTTVLNPAQGSSPATECAAAAPKWFAVVGDKVVPMPRQVVPVRLVKVQAGVAVDKILVRDHNSPHDLALADDAAIDLAEGNVFYAQCRGERPASAQRCDAPAKLAFLIDDAWEVVVMPAQTVRTLRDLFELGDDVELIRDYESPVDQTLADDEAANFTAGPVFRTERRIDVTIKVNNHPVTFKRRRVTGLVIKQTAITQGVPITLDCVLYRKKADGSFGPAIRDHEPVTLCEGAEFRCVAPDDNS